MEEGKEPQVRDTSKLYPTPVQHEKPPASASPLVANPGEYKPHGTIVNRIPQLKLYALTLVIGSIVFGIINLSALQFLSLGGNAKVAVLAVYGILTAMFITGITLMFTRSKKAAMLVLNALVVIDILFLVLSVLTLNIITSIFSVLVLIKVNGLRKLVSSLM